MFQNLSWSPFFGGKEKKNNKTKQKKNKPWDCIVVSTDVKHKKSQAKGKYFACSELCTDFSSYVLIFQIMY